MFQYVLDIGGSSPRWISSFILWHAIFSFKALLGCFDKCCLIIRLNIGLELLFTRALLGLCNTQSLFVLPPFLTNVFLYFLLILSFSIQLWYDKKLPCLIGKSKPSFRNCEHMSSYQNKNLLEMFYATYICRVLFHSMQYC
jgi:hypothetical protein